MSNLLRRETPSIVGEDTMKIVRKTEVELVAECCEEKPRVSRIMNGEGDRFRAYSQREAHYTLSRTCTELEFMLENPGVSVIQRMTAASAKRHMAGNANANDLKFIQLLLEADK